MATGFRSQSLRRSNDFSHARHSLGLSLLQLPLAIARFLQLRFSDFVLQFRKLSFQIRQVLIHLRAVVRELRLQTRNLSPDLLNFRAAVCHRFPQTCQIGFD
jgi:hypothetical protein